MHRAYSRTAVALWLISTIGLPAILVLGAVRNYRALDAQREVYLRGRMAALASQLETAPEAAAEDPGLLDLAILDRPADGEASPLAALWDGRELFRTVNLRGPAGERIFRAFVPFHSAQGLRLARLDLDASEADFLTGEARGHVVFVLIGSVALVALSVYSMRNLRRQMELEHLARIGSMSAVLAHEIRNPLGTIKGFAQLCLEQAAPAQRALLDPIVQETLRLESLVKDLLLYGRPAQPAWKVVRAQELAATLSRHTPGAPLFEATVPDVAFSTDPNLLEQALLNLVRNAIEAVEGRVDAQVRLIASTAGREVIWRVEDNGPGLSPEALRQLFEPFRTTKSFGTGLGLSITRKLATALGGSLTVSNRAEGGAVAEIRLPLRRP